VLDCAEYAFARRLVRDGLKLALAEFNAKEATLKKFFEVSLLSR